ncbi:MAG TPA: hypothetical protein VGA36_09885 [Nitriliruptorales bacterium]
MTLPPTWIADDLARPQRRGRLLVAWLSVVTAAVGLAAVLFLATGPTRPAPELRGPGIHGRLASVDLLPGYEVDAGRAELGPARVVLHDGRPVFIPARTPYTGARPCPSLRLPEGAADGSCMVFVWLGEDGHSATWVTLLRPGGPGESLLDGRLLAASDERLVLQDGTTVPPQPGMRLSECAELTLAEVVGTRVVVSIDDATGTARQITCRA